MTKSDATMTKSDATMTSTTSMTSVLVYRYGITAPSEERERVFDQMECAHRFRNTLVEIERGRRAAERAFYAALSEKLSTLTQAAKSADDEVERLETEIRKERARTRKRSDGAEQREALKIARKVKSVVVKMLREARNDLRTDPAVIAARDALSERAGELVRSARKYSGLASAGPHFGAWGTYQLVEEAAQASFKSTPLYCLDGITPNDPGFVRRTGDGAVSVQIQGGATVEEVFGDHIQLRITPPDERAWLKMPDNGWSARRRFARQGDLRMCLGTDIEGKRIFGRWRLDMHRQLPKGAIIKRATVRRRMSGPYAHWSVELTIECPQRPILAPTHGGAIAIDLGWRVMGEGADKELRVAGWADTSGRHGDVRLDVKMLGWLRDPDRIRGRRDCAFDLQVLHLSRWLDTFTRVPAWLAEATQTLKAWKSAARLTALRNRWREARFAGDEIMFAALDAWATADRHYWAQESRRRDAALRARREQYRVFAAKIADEYETIVLERFDLRVFAVRPAAEAEKAENETARSNRHLAAVSELRMAILNAATSRGRTAVGMSAVDTTRQCPVCGTVEVREAAESVVLACACGAVWDQDTHGAAPVLLQRWTTSPGDIKVLVPNEEKEKRRVRVRRLRDAKVERMGGQAGGEKAAAGGKRKRSR